MDADKGDWEGQNGTKQLFQDAQELYHQNQDVESLAECIRLRKALREVYDASEQSAADLIRQYQQKVDQLEQKAAEFAAMPASTPQIEKLKKEIDASLKAIEEQKENEKATASDVDVLEQKLNNLRLQHKELEKTSVVQVPLMKHSLSLYANITKIKWDFSSENVAGSMINTDTGNIKTFEFSEDKESAFDIANKIWDVIEA